ncbi:unnamed protein product [Nippostrongylus brasiliensis]|uniref:WH2 domain-containing protein n=1 Tax=Nippostrongylus brasiliensis TaxID=27835 RepID=A0A158R035_NIPBR|nr:unnamed protein product [Nippostrongylus brasiliensis]
MKCKRHDLGIVRGRRNGDSRKLESAPSTRHPSTMATTEFKVTPVRLHGDAPYSHRRLYGIRRLKVIRPLVTPSTAVERTATVRRHQATNEVAANLADYVPRAQVPPRFGDSSEVLSRLIEVQATTKKESDPPTLLEDFDEEKRKRIEARWKRLGINMRTIQYPIKRLNFDKSHELEKLSTIPRAIPPPDEKPTEVPPPPKKEEIRVTDTRKSVPSQPPADKDGPRISPHRPRIHGPLLGTFPSENKGVQQQQLPRFASPIVTPSPNSDYHSRTQPPFKSYKYAQKLSQRPRLRIRRPGEKSILENSIQEDPNLTPFQNSARTRFGYGRTAGPSSSSASNEVLPTTLEPSTTTVTTPEPTTTTEAVPEPETGSADSGDSGAGFGFGPSELPPELANVGFGIGGNGINFNVPASAEASSSAAPPPPSPPPRPTRPKQRKQPNPEIFKEGEPLVIPQNSGLRPVSPPKEFIESGGGFGSGSGSGGGGGFGGGSGGGIGGGSGSGLGAGSGGGGGGGGRGRGGGGGGGGSGLSQGSEPDPELFTGESALTPSRGPTGDGYGPPIFPGGAVPPPVPAVGLGGAAAGKSPYGSAIMEPTENPPTTMKPSALLNVLNKADQGLNQAISHFEQRSPLETAAIDILEVALGSQKLDSQAKLLGHVDRTIGLDNLQRIQRWANTAGAMDVFKEEVVKLLKNFEPPEDLFPTLPPQFEYLLKPSGR